MKKPLSIIITAVVVILIAILYIRIRNTNVTIRPIDLLPTVKTSINQGPIFADPFLQIQAPLPESFESGLRSTVDGWDSLTIVPVGNTQQLPTYPFLIDYRTRTSQQIADAPSLLQTLFQQTFSAEKTVTIVGQSVQQYKSIASNWAYRAVLFTRKGQDILIVAKAQDEGMMSSYIAGYDAFLSSLQVQVD